MEGESPIVVALVPTPRDLEIARMEGWYRVPLAKAPACLMGAHGLALYQPGSFGVAERWRIAWWARVTGYETTTRGALLPAEADHPRAAEAYLRVNLGPLQPLEPPLVSETGRRLLFVATTWARLCEAQTLGALRPPRPIADDPLYHLIQRQLDDVSRGIPDPGSTHQPRLFREDEALFEEEIPDW